MKEKYDDFVRNCEIYQFMGKDNVPFHSIFFPAMCLSSGTNFLVDVISSTEYLLFENRKFSKSNKVGIFGSELVSNEYGEASVWRYYLMKIRPESKDTNFTFADFRSSVAGDLVNNIGNLCNRVLKYIRARMDGVVQYTVAERDQALVSKIDGLYSTYLSQMEKIEFKHAIKTMLHISDLGNEYIQGAIKAPKETKNSSFCIGASIVLLIGHLAEPFMPSVSKRIFEMLLVNPCRYPEKFELLSCGHVISHEIHPLFRNFTREECEKMESRS